VEQQRRISRERAAIVERVVSSLAHALGTPLQVIAGRAAMIRMDAVDDELRDHARIIEKKVQDVTQLLQRLLDFARGRDFEDSESDLVDAMREALSLVGPLAEERGVRLDLQGETSARCLASRETLLLLATNLAVDAVDASGAAGTVRFTVHSGEPAPPSFTGSAQEGVAVRIELPEGGTVDSGAFERAHEPWMKSSPGDRDVALRRAVVLGVLRRVGGCLELSMNSTSPTLVVWIPSVAG
jgi:signal transduction histidine kinase